MRRTHSPQQSYLSRPTGNDPRLSIVAFVARVIIALFALVLMVPRPIVLPAFSLCALAAAAFVALSASLRARSGASPPVFIWNLAGAFTLVGCAAAILGEVEAIVEYTRLTTPRSKADD
jgi:hypothetical protein